MIDLKQINRSLRRSPLFTITVIGTLALGIGATAAIFTVVDGVLIRPLPYHDADRLVTLWHSLLGLNIPTAGQSIGTYFHYKKTAHSLSSIAGYIPTAMNLSDAAGTHEAERIPAAQISANLLPTLGVAPSRGRNFTAAEDLPNGGNVALVGDALWKRRFGGDSAIIGRSIQVNGKTYQVIGVMPPTFHFPDPSTNLWLPLQLDPATRFAGGFSMAAIGRLAPGATVESAQTELNQLLPRLSEAYPDIFPSIATANLMAQAHARARVSTMQEAAVGDFAGVLWVVVATVALVLVVACANVANLMLVRAQSRAREIAVRSALGAGRSQIVSRFVAEALVLAVAGSALGLGLATIGIRVLVHSGNTNLPRLNEVSVTPWTFAFTALIAVIAATACSMIPAFRHRSADLGQALRDGGRAGTVGRSQHRAQHALVIVQMALAVLLLAGSGLLIRTVAHLRRVQPGFDPSHTLAFTLTLPTASATHASDVARFYANVVDRVRALPGVSDAGVVSKLPLVGGESLAPAYVEHQPVEGSALPPVFPFPAASSGYFAAMRIRLLAGRTFLPPDDPTGMRDVIVSRAFAERYWHDSTGAAAVGQHVRVSEHVPWSTIVGVVESVRDTSLTAAPVGEVYFPLAIAAPTTPDSLAPMSPRVMSVVIRTAGDPLSLAAPARRAISALNPAVPIYDVQPMSDILARSTAQTTFVLGALAAAAAITLILGAVGLYGVIAYTVSLRTRELGLRLALGAEPRSIHALVLREGAVLALAGVGAGLATFLVVGRLLRRLLFGVGPADPATLLTTVAMLTTIGLLASWWPARRAARTDPLDALRAE